MTASTLFIALIVLACPLMMVLMMRGGQGHGGHAHGEPAEPAETSVDDLRRRRAELDRLTDERENGDSEHELTPWGGGGR